jgi:uncharacterized protein (DUF342 family)
MWKRLLSLTENGNSVIAKLEQANGSNRQLSEKDIPEALESLGAKEFYLDQEAIVLFVNSAKEGNKEAYAGICIAERRNASVEVEVAEAGMIANMIVTGAYGGRALRGSELVHALAQANVTKGINKVALKKVLIMSKTLSPGEVYTQPVAQGKSPINGSDSRFMPLVEDFNKRVLSPQHKENSTKLDMRNLGETITVGEGDEVMRRIPATKGKSGYTVQGKELPPKPGNESPLKEGKGTCFSPKDPNILIATTSGLPIIKDKTIDIDNALCMKNIGVGTGHVKFKGSLVVTGNIEPGMIVRATGSITVGGFVESADVVAQGDILIGKGIIGHTVPDNERRTCVIKSKGSIKANYAQYCELQATEDIYLAIHSIGNHIRCGRELKVLDSKEQQGTLSGGTAKAGNNIICANLGVEGDTVTRVEAFGSYASYKEKLFRQKELYQQAQDATMQVIRKEIEFNKKPKSERTSEDEKEIETEKERTNEEMMKEKKLLNRFNEEFEALLLKNTIEVKNKVFSHVVIQFGDVSIVTKRSYGASVFSFTQYEIKSRSLLNDNDIASDM